MSFFLSIFTIMKKYTFIFALGVIVTLSACGNGSTTPESTDSTGAQVDTTAVIATDSTAQSVPDSSANVK